MVSPKNFERKRKYLLVDFLSHDVRPINHAGPEIEVDGAGAPRVIDDGDHAVPVVQSNLADVGLVSE